MQYKIKKTNKFPKRLFIDQDEWTLDLQQLKKIRRILIEYYGDFCYDVSEENLEVIILGLERLGFLELQEI